MSKLGEAILKAIVSNRKRSQRGDPSGNGAQLDGSEEYFRWQFESSEALFAKYPNWDIQGKTVLEIGCGLGGRSAYLAASGARCVVGIDINAGEIHEAPDLCARVCPKALDRIQYLSCKENERLPIGQFDVVILVDAMEHVVSPYQVVQAAYDYVVPGGKFYFSSYGWYHHSGSHTGLLPFVNVLFSDETILNVIRWNVSRPDYVPTMWDSDPPIKRWQGIYDLRDRPGEHLNKITLREMKKLARYAAFPHSRLNILGFGGNHKLLRVLNPLRHIPVLQEVFHSYVVGEFRK